MPGIILNVDDSPALVYARSAVLRKEGFTVVDAYTGEQALALVRREAPALVLLDIRLPDIGGLEVCRRIKSDPATARTLVLHVSAASSIRPPGARRS